MYFKIKNKIESYLRKSILNLDRICPPGIISPLLKKEIGGFAARKGKRLRPILFVIGYLGYAKRPCENLYAGAVSLELLHDFLIIHDDIIDKSDMRRGKPSVHKRFADYLARCKNVQSRTVPRSRTGARIKFSGQDLALVAGDIMYAMAMHAFLSIKEDPARKEKAFKNLIQSSMYACAGEFAELITGIKDLKSITKREICGIYDSKTAFYSFASPLSTGAILAGAGDAETARLKDAALRLGRAFQIKDDILGMFGKEKEMGKSSMTDIKEGKRTLLVWYAYNNSGSVEKKRIGRIFSKKMIDRSDLAAMRKILAESGAVDYARSEIKTLLKKAAALMDGCGMREKYKTFLKDYTEKLIKV